MVPMVPMMPIIIPCHQLQRCCETSTNCVKRSL
jgi:hypothetical protein